MRYISRNPGENSSQQLGRLLETMDGDLFDGLSDEQRSTLTALLERVAKTQGLQEGVYPGYRNILADTRPKSLLGKNKN
jgi:hypothetical protein